MSSRFSIIAAAILTLSSGAVRGLEAQAPPAYNASMLRVCMDAMGEKDKKNAPGVAGIRPSIKRVGMPVIDRSITAAYPRRSFSVWFHVAASGVVDSTDVAESRAVFPDSLTKTEAKFLERLGRAKDYATFRPATCNGTPVPGWTRLSFSGSSV